MARKPRFMRRVVGLRPNSSSGPHMTGFRQISKFMPIEPLEQRCLLCTIFTSLAELTDLPGPSPVSSIATADFNGDGDMDLVTANTATDNVSILLGNGSGGFAKTDYAVGASPCSVFVADLNEDSKLDIVAANSGSSTVSVLLGDGAGGFTRTDFSAGDSITFVAAADLDGDSHLDLAVLNGGSVNRATVFRGDGNGSFAESRSFTTGSGPVSLATGDFDGNGSTDMAIANSAANTVSVLLNDGLGTFARADYTVGSAPVSIAAGDMNNDGKQDLMVANQSSSNISVLLGNGMGGFTQQKLSAGASPHAVVAADFNRDGRLDLAMPIGIQTVRVLLGDGVGGSYDYSDFTTGSQGSSAATGDFDGDGKIDLAVGFQSSGATVLKNAVGDNPPTVSLTAASLVQGNDLKLQGNGYDPDGDLLTYTWDFNGDGDFSDATGRAVTISWAAVQAMGFGLPGTYSAFQVQVNDDHGHMATSSIGQLTVLSWLPTANTDGPYSVGLGQALRLRATGSSDPNKETLSFAWDINGDGDFSDAAGSSVNLTWAQLQALGICEPGTYPLQVAVSNSHGTSYAGSELKIQSLIMSAIGHYPGLDSGEVVAADFNNDGKTDLAQAHWGKVGIFFGNGNGTFAANTVYTVNAGAESLAAGDINGDGVTDLVTGNSSAKSISVLLGQPEGQFSETDYGVGLTVLAVAVADFNGDGRLDVAELNAGSGTVGVFLGDGNGGLGAMNQLNTSYISQSMAAADFNGDGKADLANSGGIWLSQGNGGFVYKASGFSSASDESILAADFNNDGIIDLASADSSPGTVEIFTGRGDGTFDPRITLQTDETSTRPPIAAADLNGDGWADIVTGNNYDLGVVEVFCNNGNGGFDVRVRFPADTYATSIVAADFNSDGKADLATNDSYGGVNILLNESFFPNEPLLRASANGPYSIQQGTDLTLRATASCYIAGAVLSYGWDLNGDGDFSDAYGASPTVSWARLTELGASVGTYHPRVMVGDDKGDVVTSPEAQLVILNLPPTASAGGPYIVGPGQSLTLNASGSSDPVDPITCTWDLNGDGNYSDASGITPTLTWDQLTALGIATVGTHTMRVRVADPYGATAEATASLKVQSIAMSLGSCFSTGTGTRSIAAGDFNGDGNLDLVFPSGAITLGMRLGDGNGGFGPVASFTVGSNPDFVAAADLNNDGNCDLVSANGGANTISVLLGDGNGGFGPKADFATGTDPVSVAVADFNGDGAPDLAVANYVSSTVRCFIGDGAGSFVIAGDVPVMYNFAAASVAAADITGDGKIDIVAGRQSASPVILVGHGDGGFTPSNFLKLLENLQDSSEDEVGITGDFNRDGKDDLAMISFSYVAIALNAGDHLGVAASSRNGLRPCALAAADFDGDGKMDVASADKGSNLASIFLGNGSGGFGLISGFPVGASPQGIIAADFNNDGKPDLATANVTDGTVSVLLNVTPFTVTDYPPAVSLGGPYSVKEDSPVTLNMWASDPEKEALAFSWDLNGDGDYSDVQGRSPTVDWTTLAGLGLEAPGTYNGVRVRVDDGHGHVVFSDSTSLTILPNEPPDVLAGGPYAVTEGFSLTLSAAGWDPERDLLTYSWDMNGDGDFTDAVGAHPTLDWPQLRALGISPANRYNVRVRVDDGHGNCAVSPTVELTVRRAGDASGDGLVSFYDFLLLQANFGKPGSYEQGDFNGDGKVSFADYLLLERNFGKSIAPPVPSPAPAPVPTVLAAPLLSSTVKRTAPDAVQSVQARTLAMLNWTRKPVSAAKGSRLLSAEPAVTLDLLAVNRVIYPEAGR